MFLNPVNKRVWFRIGRAVETTAESVGAFPTASAGIVNAAWMKMAIDKWFWQTMPGKPGLSEHLVIPELCFLGVAADQRPT